MPGLHHSVESHTRETWCRAPSCKQQASSIKLFKASSNRPQACDKLSRVTMSQDTGSKPQAASCKQGWFESFWGVRQIVARHYVTMSQRLKVQAASFKPRATSIKLQAASCELFNIFSFVKFHVIKFLVIKFRDTRSERLY
jgi:hypothetical protein